MLEEFISVQKSADSEAWRAVSTARRGGRRERQKRAQQTEREEGGEEKKIHTRPVMQKHRFNVRLGSVISAGERKKLGWTGREERGWRLDAEEAEAHPEALGRMPVILLMEHSERAFEEIESTEGSPGPGPHRWSPLARDFREDGTPIEATPAPSLDKQSYNVLN